jgi:hypothetical protein
MLEDNRIGNYGAKHLADALRNNTVDLIFSSFVLFVFHFSTQTITSLVLRLNKITAEGAQHLAEALRNNTVNLFLSSHLFFTFSLLNTDTHLTQSFVEWNRRQWGSIFG